MLACTLTGATGATGAAGTAAATGAKMGVGVVAATGAVADAAASAGCTSECTTTKVLPASAIGPGAERSASDNTTAAPAVAPIAVATTTIRAVRMKLGAGAR